MVENEVFMSKKNINSIQVLRAFAACLVAGSHILYPSYHVAKYIGNIGVDLFFVLSGFLMVITYRESRTGIEFILNRIRRIYPCYLIMSMPLILFVTITRPSFCFDFIHNVTLLPTIDGGYLKANSVSWTLTYEMYFYLVMATCMQFSKGVTKVTALTAIVITVFFIFTGGLSGGQAGWLDTTLKHLTSNCIVFDFVMGSMLGVIYNQNHGFAYPCRVNNNVKLVVCFIVFSVSLATLTVLKVDGGSDAYQLLQLVFSGVPAVLILAIVITIDIPENKLCSIALNIGNASYSIYLTHFYIAKSMGRMFSSHLSVISPVAFLVSIGVGCLAYKMIELKINFLMRDKLKFNK